MAREEWELEAGGMKFFCWRDDEGKIHGAASHTDAIKVEAVARLLRAYGWGAVIVKEGLWLNLTITDQRVPSHPGEIVVDVYEGDGEPVLEPKRKA